MIKRNRISFFVKSTFLKHLLFWALVFVYYTSAGWQHKKDLIDVSKGTIFELVYQIIIAYLIIHILIPNLLQKNKRLLFIFFIILLVIFAHFSFSIYLNYFLIKPPNHNAYAGFLERMTYSYGYITTLISYFSPAIFLLVFNYYKGQKEVANILEQKRKSELDALKNQLNPHFLFNTLNNLYVLALIKSDKTPEVISKLSEILDYILYRCNANFVSLNNEILLLKNYISLEQVRYGKRVAITFNEDITSELKIAPLLLLTLLENAFKHGVREEVNTAKIEINLVTENNSIDFLIKNTKPSTSEGSISSEHNAIGLQNIRKQLDLLYSKNYKLDIKDDLDMYSVNLKIISNDV